MEGSEAKADPGGTRRVIWKVESIQNASKAIESSHLQTAQLKARERGDQTETKADPGGTRQVILEE